MSEYWKSTPKYWCKHCGVFVRDTKLERTNHESTGKHQGAIKRSLRDLHRGAEQKEREKERVRRELERLDGVVSRSTSSASGAQRPVTTPSQSSHGAPPPQPSQADRQKQMEQLAELGVSIPTELRGDMAMAGEWTVTTTRVIESAEKREGPPAEGRATGVKREREQTEEEKEHEEAIKGLFKKPRKWGVGSKTMPTEEDVELEALLSGPLVRAKKEESGSPQIKTEDRGENDAGVAAQDGGAGPVETEPGPSVKNEPDEETTTPAVGAAIESTPGLPPVSEGAESIAAPSGIAAPATAILFKKRKAKNIRHK